MHTSTSLIGLADFYRLFDEPEKPRRSFANISAGFGVRTQNPKIVPEQNDAFSKIRRLLRRKVAERAVEPAVGIEMFPTENRKEARRCRCRHSASLGRQVAERAVQAGRLHHAGLARLGHKLGQPEVRHHRAPAAVQKHVAGSEVSAREGRSQHLVCMIFTRKEQNSRSFLRSKWDGTFHYRFFLSQTYTRYESILCPELRRKST